MPEELNDRTQDNWRPLLAIADLAGGEWPERARRAAKLLSGVDEDEDDLGPLLLSDLHRIFEKHRQEQLPSALLVKELNELDDRPWAEFRKGQPLTPNTLSRLLRPFGVKPKKLRFGTETRNGYERSAFVDAWRRYLPAEPPAIKPEHPEQAHHDGENRAFANRNTEPSVPVCEQATNPHHDCIVPDVPVSQPGGGEEDNRDDPPRQEGNPKPSQPSQPHNDGQNGHFANRNISPSVTVREEAANPHYNGIVTGVTVSNPDPAQDEETEYF